MANEETPAERKLREELAKEAARRDKEIKDEQALAQIRARAKAKEEKGKKTSKKDEKRKK
jgi:hypothetical protein